MEEFVNFQIELKDFSLKLEGRDNEVMCQPWFFQLVMKYIDTICKERGIPLPEVELKKEISRIYITVEEKDRTKFIRAFHETVVPAVFAEIAKILGLPIKK